MSSTTTLSWQDQLDAVGRRGELPPAALAVMTRTVEYIARTAPGLAAGQTAPDFTLPDQAGQPVSLAALRRHGPVVLVFYRGTWCPYCNVVLSAMAARRAAIEALGGSLIAVSPQAPGTPTGASNFPLLCDQDQAVIAAYRLGYETPGEQRALVRGAFGLDLAEENADGSWRLPASATYVIDTDGTIVLAGVTAAPNRRADPDVVLDALAAVT